MTLAMSSSLTAMSRFPASWWTTNSIPRPEERTLSEESVSILPFLSMYPRRNIWAMRSMRPEPHIPRGRLFPMMVMSMSVSVILMVSMAPPMARMPQDTSPPSNAGPAEVEHPTSHSLLPSTTSPLVPTSIRRDSSSRRCRPERSMSAVISPPT